MSSADASYDINNNNNNNNNKYRQRHTSHPSNPTNSHLLHHHHHYTSSSHSSSSSQSNSRGYNTEIDIALDSDTNEFSILLTALDKVNLIDTLMSFEPFTVFAPTNDAFLKLINDLGITADELLNIENLQVILNIEKNENSFLKTKNKMKITIQQRDCHISSQTKTNVSNIDIDDAISIAIELFHTSFIPDRHRKIVIISSYFKDDINICKKYSNKSYINIDNKEIEITVINILSNNNIKNNLLCLTKNNQNGLISIPSINPNDISNVINKFQIEICQQPTNTPTHYPTIYPTNDPTIDPTNDPTSNPTKNPAINTTIEPTIYPTNYPSINPTFKPTTQLPTTLTPRACSSFDNEIDCIKENKCEWYTQLPPSFCS